METASKKSWASLHHGERKRYLDHAHMLFIKNYTLGFADEFQLAEHIYNKERKNENNENSKNW